MRHIRRVSILITLAGAAVVAAAAAFDLNQSVALTGMLAVVAGLVKAAMVGLWRGVAGFGAASPSSDEPSPSGELRS